MPSNLISHLKDSASLRVRMGFHFASLIVHTADTSPACARQASRDKRT